MLLVRVEAQLRGYFAFRSGLSSVTYWICFSSVFQLSFIMYLVPVFASAPAVAIIVAALFTSCFLNQMTLAFAAGAAATVATATTCM